MKAEIDEMLVARLVFFSVFFLIHFQPPGPVHGRLYKIIAKKKNNARLFFPYLLGEQVSRMKAEIDEMLEHYHDNDTEVYIILSNTITLHDHMKMAMERNDKAQVFPYLL